MTKKVIRLTESDLRNIIKENLNELNWKTYANAAKKRLKQNKDSNFKDKEAFDKYWELRKMANKKFDDEFVGNLKYDTFGDKWKGKHSPKLDTPNIEPGVTPSGRFSGYNKSGNKLFSPKKGSYYSSNGGYTTPRNFFRDAEVADAFVKANDELWDYYNDEYEYKNGEGWKKKEADIDKIVKESVKRVLKEGFAEKYDHATEIIDYFANMLYENPNRNLSPKQKEQVANALRFLQETDTNENPNTTDWIELAQNLLK